MVSPPECALQPAIYRTLTELQCPAVIDSGGFQGMTDVHKYADILLQTHHFFEWFPNLDAIGNQSKSNQNYEKLCDILPSEIRAKLIWVYQGGDVAMIEDYAKVSPLIGVGGLVPLSQHPAKLRAYLDSIIPTIIKTGVKTHLFGCTSASLLKWLAFQDWFYSADSSRWLYGMRSCEILTKNGKSFNATEMGFAFSPIERAKHNIRVLQSFLEPQKALQLEMMA